MNTDQLIDHAIYHNEQWLKASEMTPTMLCDTEDAAYHATQRNWACNKLREECIDVPHPDNSDPSFLTNYLNDLKRLCARYPLQEAALTTDDILICHATAIRAGMTYEERQAEVDRIMKRRAEDHARNMRPDSEGFVSLKLDAAEKAISVARRTVIIIAALCFAAGFISGALS